MKRRDALTAKLIEEAEERLGPSRFLGRDRIRQAADECREAGAP